ncbi:unnamed protein product [Prorocentrum cordatum]|uniref:RanBP2-type domain-containing protein n=1 Tax=Prorocentrum cordatum TaxID=2364126 RepID=A0ABN9WRQ7_9DINO|nr:unnamed protein product [Polarella glacialis]
MAARGQPHARRWECKSCINDRTGNAWWNYPDAKKCAFCYMWMPSCFKCHVEPPTPSFRKGGGPPWQKGKDYKDAIAKTKGLESKVKRLKTHGAAAAPPSDAAAMSVDSQGSGAEAAGENLSGAETTELRHRLKSIDEQMAVLGKFASDGKCGAYLQGLRAEKEIVHQKLQASRPMHAQLRTLSVRLKSGQEKLDKMRDGIVALHDQRKKLAEQMLAAEAEMQTQEGEVAALGLQMQELSAKCGGAPQKAELGEKVPDMSIDVEALGRLLSQHGVAQEQCSQLAGALASAMPQATRQPAQGAGDGVEETQQQLDEGIAKASEEQLREHLGPLLGDACPADLPGLRDAAKRVAELSPHFLPPAAKKGEVAEEGEL